MLVISHAITALSLKSQARLLKRQSGRENRSTEDRRCYHPKWFTEGECKLHTVSKQTEAVAAEQLFSWGCTNKTIHMYVCMYVGMYVCMYVCM